MLRIDGLIKEAKALPFSQTEQVSKVIWQKAASPKCHSCGCEWIVIYYMVSLKLDQQHRGPQFAKRHLDWFTRFAQYVRVTNTQTDTQTTLRATSVEIGRKLMHCVQAMRL